MIALFFALIFFLIDIYFYQAVVQVTANLSPRFRYALRLAFWIPSVLSVMAMLWWTFDNPFRYSANLRNWIITGLMATYFSKIVGVLFLLAGDLHRALRWLVQTLNPGSAPVNGGAAISRAEFFSKAALIASTVPLGGFAFGIISGAHDYRIRRQRIAIKDLPRSFDGIRLAQVSDIHSGSFWNKTAVQGGVEMLLDEKPDVIAFTGDLVNNETTEVKDYIDVFNKLRAPLGVFSVTGNHDYGDYRAWNTKAEKEENFRDLIQAHKALGFRLLKNENVILNVDGEQLAIVGIENWGAGRFSKYGKLDAALEGTRDVSTKILLSHDPSHWDAQVRNHNTHIDLTLSGHTHGFQFGVEIGGFKWSPSQYIYKQWAGLYQEQDHMLYVNRGFGYLGYPGRVGIPPEITILELVRA
jgi:predicted MPP superfamily phosphohydrolase